MASINQIPRGHHRQKTKLQETSRLHMTKKITEKLIYSRVQNSPSDVNARIMKNIYIATVQSTLEYGAVTFEMMDRLQVSQNIHYILQSTGDNEMDGQLIYMNVTDLHQDNERNQHYYKNMTHQHGNNYYTNVG